MLVDREAFTIALIGVLLDKSYLTINYFYGRGQFGSILFGLATGGRRNVHWSTIARVTSPDLILGVEWRAKAAARSCAAAHCQGFAPSGV